MVESNICTRCAVGLRLASASKKASKTPALLKRSNRFHTLFQWPKHSGKARQRTFSTAKKCRASRNSLSSAPLRPRLGKHARKTVKVRSQSSSVILVDIGSDSQFSRNPMNHNRFPLEILYLHLNEIRPHSLATPGPDNHCDP